MWQFIINMSLDLWKLQKILSTLGTVDILNALILVGNGICKASDFPIQIFLNSVSHSFSFFYFHGEIRKKYALMITKTENKIQSFIKKIDIFYKTFFKTQIHMKLYVKIKT